MDLASECIFCGRRCFEMHTLGQNELFSSWTVKCEISLSEVLDCKASQANTKGIFPRYCFTCFQLVLDVDYYLNGIRRFESLLSSVTAKLQNIIEENKWKEESGLGFNYEETESVTSGIADADILISKCDLIDEQSPKHNQDEETKKERKSKNTRDKNLTSSTHHLNRKYIRINSDPHVAPVLQCPFMDCHIQYPDQFTLSKHVHREHQREKRSGCQFCGLTFNQREDGVKDLEHHETSHRDSEVPFSCVVRNCPCSFTNFQDLRRHVLEKHEETVLRCDICPGKVFRTFLTLKSHRDQIHSSKKEDGGLNCLYPGCSFIATSRSRLHNHRSIHKADRPHMCDECGSTYKSRGTLKRHKFVHTGETPFKCKYCSKSFNMNHKLKNHEETHAPTLSYLCSECGKAFRSKKNLSQHTTFHCPTRATTRPSHKKGPVSRERRKCEEEELIEPHGSNDLRLIEVDGELPAS